MQICVKSLNRLFRFNIGMASPDVLKRLESKATAAEQMITVLKSEVEQLKKNQNDSLRVDRSADLARENESLLREIEKYKSELINLETRRGIIQISPADGPVETPSVNTPVPKKDVKVRTNKENKANKATKEKVVAESQEPPIDVGRLDFRVGRIVDAKKHPDADTLYVEEIDVGENKNRTVVSGLVKYVPIEELRQRMVVLLCNLKPSKMRGVTSEAMVMCASTPDKVEILVPPPDAVPGDLVHVEGYPRIPDSILNPKKKIFETCAPDLTTDENRQAVYKGVPLHVPGKGPIVAPTLTRVQVK